MSLYEDEVIAFPNKEGRKYAKHSVHKPEGGLDSGISVRIVEERCYESKRAVKTNYIIFEDS